MVMQTLTEDRTDNAPPMREAALQFAALAFDLSKARPRYLIVTSRRTGRWIFPKGQRKRGEKGWSAAAREAREEAGVIGTPLPREIGRYRTLKIRPEWVQPLEVALYPVRIKRLLPDWDEDEQRARRLVDIDEAVALLAQEDMAALCARFDRQLAKDNPRG